MGQTLQPVFRLLPRTLSCHYVIFWLFSWSCAIAQNSLLPDTGNGFLLLKGILGEGKTDEERMDEWPEEVTAVCTSDDILCWSETMTDRVMLMLVMRRQWDLSGLFFCLFVFKLLWFVLQENMKIWTEKNCCWPFLTWKGWVLLYFLLQKVVVWV